METGNGTPIPGTTRIWRLNLGKEGPQRSGIEANVYVGDVAPGVTDYALMQLFKAKWVFAVTGPHMSGPPSATVHGF